MRRGAAAFLLAFLGAAALAAAQQARLYEAPEDLPEGEGRDDAFYQCSACHGFNLVTRQGMSRALWEDTWDLMVERHGMADPGPEAREIILSYLAETFPPQRNRAAGRTPLRETDAVWCDCRAGVPSSPYGRGLFRSCRRGRYPQIAKAPLFCRASPTCHSPRHAAVRRFLSSNR